ncbi:hypothetical protein FGG08_003104 [Glutinoglossum americanum]|uniref:Uncharacterized protein n=1 Tax=Glutinoglossum americanum TaxID=1670608 RepID=A0A9P8KYI0_9PEZI|nr:hypothetical protein FGG08_003104 [Glutinoglossum americanum]
MSVYNSAVFDMLAANEYNIAVVSEDFLTGAKWNTANSNASSAIQRMWEQSSKFERLDRELCIKAYGSSFVSDRNDVIVVSEKTDPDNALLGYLDWAYPEYQNSWICNTTTTKSLQLETIPIEHFDCSPSVALEGIESWVMAGEPVSYCLSRPVDEKCRLQFSLHIMIVVIVCNAVKSVCMIVTGKWVTGEKKKKGDGPLIVVGDAVASFLETEDERTKGMCLLTKREVEGGAWRLMPGPRKWEPKRKFWFLASWKRWVGANVLGKKKKQNLPSENTPYKLSLLQLISSKSCLTSLGLIGYLFSLGLHRISVSEDIGSLWRLGFGTITPSTLIPMKLHPLATNSLLANVLIANLPQALMSVIYLSYNGVFTCMLVAKEWSRFADQRRGLRVTEPKGSQTSSHFLSLPYAYAAPLLVFSVTIHWLVSQSIFLAQIVVFSPTGQPNPSVSVSTCGYSPIAIIFAMAAAGLLVASNLALGFRRYRADIPLVGSCSVAISAACHRSKLEGPEIAYEKVQWGVVRRNEEEVGSTYGHCSFSAEEVEVPEIGVYYAGESSPDLRPGAEGGISF